MNTYTATHAGQTISRRGKAVYTHVSLVVLPWNSPEPVMYAFHTSETLALKGSLTGQMKKNGARVVGVVPVVAA